MRDYIGIPFFVLPMIGRLRPVPMRPESNLSPFSEFGDKVPAQGGQIGKYDRIDSNTEKATAPIMVYGCFFD